MREMKDSGVEWIGEIPKTWVPTKLKYAYQYANVGESIDKEYCTEMGEGYVFYTAGANPIGTKYEEFPGEKYTRKNDLLLARNGTPYVYLPIDGAVYSDHIIRIDIDIKYDRRFLRYCLQRAIESIKVETVSIATWSISLWKEQILPLPSLTEQKRLADYLDSKCAKIDSIIEKQQAIIEKLKEYKLSVITEVVTKGLDPDIEMKDSGIEWIGKIPKNWNVAKLKNYCELKTGSTPSTSELEWFDGDIKWYTPGDFSENYYLGQSSRTLSQKAKDDNVATIIPENTVMIVGIGATAGKIGFTKEECSCNQQITALKTKKMDASYLMYWMIANTKFLRETAMYTTLPILNNQTIGNYIIVTPSDIKEERKIAEFLDVKSEQIESKISNTYSIINKLSEYKKSLIYEVVTGKKEV